MFRSRSLLVTLGAAVTVAGASGARAQTPDTVVALPTCDGRVISGIDVQPHPPAIVGRGPGTIGRAVQRFLLQSSTSRASVVRPYVIADVGDSCDDELLAEAARALRALPYIGSATVRAIDDSAQGVRLLVETVDEVPLVIGGGWDDGLSSFAYGNDNLGGRGLRVVGRWRQSDAFRDGFALNVRQYALLGQPILLSLDLAREPLGSNVSYSVTFPYLSERQHFSWQLGGQQTEIYHPFIRESGPTLSLPVKRDAWTAGFLTRFTWGNTSLLLGPVAAYERSRPAAVGVAISDSGLAPPDTGALSGRYAPYTGFRVGAALGLRFLDFTVAHGFDALLAEQDIARGVQVAAIVARAIDAFEADDRSGYYSAVLYAGAGGPRSFAGLQVVGEGQPETGTGEWNAVVLSGRAAWYIKPSERRTLEASAVFTGGWRERLPLQLPIGVARTGVRGFRDATIAGGRRAVFRLEQRTVRGSTGAFLDWGTAVFVDVGNTWSGDVPFGETEAARTSLGVGLLAAVPPTSKRMFRADVAFPVTPGSPDKVVFRASVQTAGRGFWREPGDIARTRAAMGAAGIMGWP